MRCSLSASISNDKIGQRMYKLIQYIDEWNLHREHTHERAHTKNKTRRRMRNMTKAHFFFRSFWCALVCVGFLFTYATPPNICCHIDRSKMCEWDIVRTICTRISAVWLYYSTYQVHLHSLLAMCAYMCWSAVYISTHNHARAQNGKIDCIFCVAAALFRAEIFVYKQLSHTWLMIF